VSASVNLPLHHKVQKFSSQSSGTGSPGWSRKKGRKTVVVVVLLIDLIFLLSELILYAMFRREFSSSFFFFFFFASCYVRCIDFYFLYLPANKVDCKRIMYGLPIGSRGALLTSAANYLTLNVVTFSLLLSMRYVENVTMCQCVFVVKVLTSSLSVEEVSYEEDSNIWIGPRLVRFRL